MNKGVTLIELLISIAIMLVMASLAIPIYGNLQVSSQINENSTLIIQTIKTARQDSISGINNRKHGIKFFPDNFVMFQGENYDTRIAAYDRNTSLDSALTLSTTLNNNEINFFRGSGMPDVFGTVTLTHSIGDEKTILINKFGIAEEIQNP